MVIGVDFDNTIICYDQLFHEVALRQGLIPPSVPVTKSQVRDYLRQHGKEDAWIELQGYAYGACLHEAPPFPGAREFFARCKREGAAVHIISHKTRYPFQGPVYDLHDGAHRWLTNRGFYAPGEGELSPTHVYFESTKQNKLDRISSMGCEYFIDDLPEFLAEPDFPAHVERILFDPNGRYSSDQRFPRITSWGEAERFLFKQVASS